MDIRTTPNQAQTVQAKSKFKNPNVPDNATVTHDAENDCFAFTGDGKTYSYCRPNAISEGLKLGAVVAVPAFIGAAQNQLAGPLAAGLGGTYTGVIGGLVIGGAIAGYKSYKGSNDNPVFGALGGLAGAAAGAIAFPLLKQPGLWGGYAGAAVATGLVGLGAALWTAHENRKIVQDAKSLGWQPS